ncbi:MAG TPA: hypothetical protein ENK55_12625, partial [Actinobacteria bacterium]|nr:hypothetical protein [Actinomycetota bacterium]
MIRRFAAVVVVAVASVACVGGGADGPSPSTSLPPRITTTTTTTLPEESVDALSVFDMTEGDWWLTVARAAVIVTAEIGPKLETVEIVGRGRFELREAGVASVLLGEPTGEVIRLLWPAEPSPLYPGVRPLQEGREVVVALAPFVFDQGIVSSEVFGVVFGEDGVFRDPGELDLDALAAGAEVLGSSLESQLRPSRDQALARSRLVVRVEPVEAAPPQRFLGWDYVDVTVRTLEILYDPDGVWVRSDPALAVGFPLRLAPEEARAWLADPRPRVVWLSQAAAPGGDGRLAWVPSGGSLEVLAEVPTEDPAGEIEAARGRLRRASLQEEAAWAETVRSLPVLYRPGQEPPGLTLEEAEARYWQAREEDIVVEVDGYRVVFDTWFFAQLNELGRVAVYDA